MSVYNEQSNPSSQRRPQTEKIQEIFPDFSQEELTETEETIRRYVGLVWRIYQRICREKSEEFDEKTFKR